MIKTTRLPDFPPGSNPFEYDMYHMGIPVGRNIIIMMGNHDNEICDYLIVVNTETGERIRVEFSEKSRDKIRLSKRIDRILKHGPWDPDED